MTHNNDDDDTVVHFFPLIVRLRHGFTRPVIRLESPQNKSRIQNSSTPVRNTSHRVTSEKLAYNGHKTINGKQNQLKQTKPNQNSQHEKHTSIFTSYTFYN